MALSLGFIRKGVAGFFIVAGLICFAIAAVWVLYSYHFVSTAIRASGQVVQLVERQGDNGDLFYPVFTYTDQHGTSHKVYSSVGSYPPSHQVGDSVGVLYSPGSENDARINDWLTLWLVPMVLAILGIVYLPLGTMIWQWPRIMQHWRNRKSSLTASPH